ncbi:MAG TPA: PilZ domain-containing protein [Terriglobales bacterium]|nr:PilZ domain-containing protein [Terriglobales bacterium]
MLWQPNQRLSPNPNGISLTHPCIRQVMPTAGLERKGLRPESCKITPEPRVLKVGATAHTANGDAPLDGPRPFAEQHPPDQRANPRYPINLELQYKMLTSGRVGRLGSGRTLNISSRGVLFEVDDFCPASGEIEVKMNWPFLLNGCCHLRLVMRGRVVRYDANAKSVAIKSEHHEFHTAGIANSV